MTEFKDFSKLKFNKDILKDIQLTYPTDDNYNKFEQQHQQTMNALEESRRAKEQEELRRHNELVSALRSAAENGATIVVGDNANGIQIQQNTKYSTQTITSTESFNYDIVCDVLNEIKGYFDIPQFESTFQDKADTVKEIVCEAIEAIKRKDEPTSIQSSIKILKDLAIGAGSSLIASGILGLLGRLAM